MRRRALGALAAVVAVALTLPAVGAATITGSTRLFVTPTRPGPLTNVVVRFRQPTLGGLLPADQTNESLVVTGPTRMGCVGGLDRSVTTVEAGTAMRETLRPARFVSGRWCVGRYRVALQVSQVSACPAGTAHRVCPQYVILPRTVATAHFRITRG